jgi:hypothetical protein
MAKAGDKLVNPVTGLMTVFRKTAQDADVVAVTGNPLQDIEALREVRLVLRSGVKVWPSE